VVEYAQVAIRQDSGAKIVLTATGGEVTILISDGRGNAAMLELERADFNRAVELLAAF
jgi:hypothetical protein